jgi:AcrR family transcriptional regulator
MTDSIWTRSRATSPGRETLSREQIVRAAMELLDEEGLAGLSMRKLGAKLAAGATSLYWHVQTKDDLLDLVIDEIYGEVDVPEPELAGWRAGATLFAHSLRATLLRHSWMPDVIYSRPSVGPKAMSLGSRGLALFGSAGFIGLDIDHAMGSVMAYVMGMTSSEIAWRELVKKSGKSTQEWVGDVVEQVLPVADDYPEMRESLQRRKVDPTQLQNAAFTFGLESLLDGLEARLPTNRRRGQISGQAASDSTN